MSDMFKINSLCFSIFCKCIPIVTFFHTISNIDPCVFIVFLTFPCAFILTFVSPTERLVNISGFSKIN